MYLHPYIGGALREAEKGESFSNLDYCLITIVSCDSFYPFFTTILIFKLDKNRTRKSMMQMKDEVRRFLIRQTMIDWRKRERERMWAWRVCVC